MHKDGAAIRASAAIQLYRYSQYWHSRGVSLQERLGETLQDVTEAGFHQVETELAFFANAEQAERTDACLRDSGTVMVSGYTGGALHDERNYEAIDLILSAAERGKKSGLRYVNINPDPIGRPKTEEELDLQCKSLNRLGRELDRIGIRLMVHHHDVEIRNDAHELRFMVTDTDPTFVQFCLDLHWIYRGKQDPYRFLEELLPRAKAIHLRNSVEDVWSETLGAGDLDLDRVASQISRAGFTGLLILELAYEAKTPEIMSLMEAHRISLHAMKRTFGIDES